MDDIFTIYPHPSSDKFVIQQINSKLKDLQTISVEIYNISGALTYTVSVAEGESINISELPVGIYTVLIKMEGLKTECKKLVKMH